MTYQFLTFIDLAARWQCSASRLRNARPEDLPARVKLPGSRLARFPLEEVIAFEKANTEARDYAGELKLRSTPVLGRLHRRSRSATGGRS